MARRLTNVGGITAGLVLIAAIGSYAYYKQRGRDTRPIPPLALRPADRAPLERVTLDDRDWLVHRALGFRVADPGPSFQPITAIDGGTPNTQARRASWVLEESGTARRFVITLAVSIVMSPSTYERLVADARVDLQHAGANVEAVQSTYAPGRSRCQIEATFHDRPHVMRIDTFQRPGDGRHEYTVTVTGPGELHSDVGSFRLDGR